ncbi:hypothetical protein IMZ48_25590 [Candidatus Bathyarchaeota archaeon]|nr:hypothetical protein [Chloroflexota bacterium]MBE3045855.1 hypothetical protein [Candidatus Bathyarchaeota archaeon]MBE3117513.1 hypothetical protein [Candidatus Atribacteria bacterium]
MNEQQWAERARRSSGIEYSDLHVGQCWEVFSPFVFRAKIVSLDFARAMFDVECWADVDGMDGSLKRLQWHQSWKTGKRADDENRIVVTQDSRGEDSQFSAKMLGKYIVALEDTGEESRR